MNNDPRSVGESESDDSRPLTISLTALTGSIFVVFLSWELFLDLGWEAVLLIGILLLIITLLIAVVVWLLKRIGFRPWGLRTGRRGLAAFVAVVLIGVTAAPIYGYIYGVLAARSFINQLSLDAKVVSQEILLVVPLSYGMAPDRGVTTVYALLEPTDGVISKLRDRLQNEDDWQTSNNGSFRAYCINYNQLRGFTQLPFTGSTQLEFTTEGTLRVTIDYFPPASCLLR